MLPAQFVGAGTFFEERGHTMPKGKRRENGEGSIYQRKDGRFSGYIRTEKGKKQYFYGSTRKEVQDKVRAALTRRNAERWRLVPMCCSKTSFLSGWRRFVNRHCVVLEHMEITNQ